MAHDRRSHSIADVAPSTVGGSFTCMAPNRRSRFVAPTTAADPSTSMAHDRRPRPIVDVPPTTAAPPTSSVLTSSFPTSVVAPLTAADPSTSMAHDRWSHPIADAPPTTAAPPTSTVPNSSQRSRDRARAIKNRVVPRTHFKAGKGWINELAEHHYNEMIEMQAASVEGECYLTSDDIATKSTYGILGYSMCDQALGELPPELPKVHVLVRADIGQAPRGTR
ncbi:hypothetical protein Syun_028090 [Stephania yunnanensis]|uniref:Uncharacterized protein n=1 Tax=Stephania yunnanensis TaxID=152371 RepID=A0AAP0HNE8_9MAGN